MPLRLRLALCLSLITPACSLLAWGPAPLPSLPRRDLGTQHNPAGFSVAYPIDWRRLDRGGYPMVWSLPAPPGTNLLEKRMHLDVLENAVECSQSYYGGGVGASEHVEVNGAELLHETGSGAATGHVYEWESYSVLKDGCCITITFVLHSSSPGVYSTEPSPFDRAAETAIFDDILHSFWLDP